jgi:hypothetical protein
MRNVMQMCCLLMVFAGVLLGLTLPAAAAETPAALPDWQVWSQAPLFPWDDQAAATSPYSQALNAKLDLTRRGKAGDARVYRIRRENLQYDRAGKPLTRMVAEGTIRRTLLREESPGTWVERFAWERFAVANTSSPTEMPVPVEQPRAKGISYEYSPSHYDYVNVPADWSQVQDEMAGYLMKVIAMDFSGFDAVLLGAREKFGADLTIGKTDRAARWSEPMKIGKTNSSDTAAHYRLGEMVTTVAGLTRRSGEPCVLLWFSADGNDLVQDVSTPQVTMRARGTEYFRGEVAVSLRDGRVVGGEIFGPLPWVLEMGIGGQPAKEQPAAGVIQEVSVWEVLPTPTAEAK